MPIIITRQGKHAQKVTESNFINEDNLQNFIYENPDTVPLYDIDEDIRLLILAREVPTASGSIDAIGTDANGEVYIIETKLYKNPDKRLVVAQVLDYGASISESSETESKFFKAIEAKAREHFKNNISEKLSDFYEIPVEEADSIMESFRDNLANGRFRFVVLMDHLDKRLKDLITFLNRNSKFDIYGVELEHYKYEGFEITIPKIFGSEVKKEFAKPLGVSRRGSWDEYRFFEVVRENLTDDEIAILNKFYNDIKKTADRVKWGTGAVNGSFNPIYKKAGPKSIFSVFTDGYLQLNYSWFSENQEQQKFKEQYIGLLRQIFTIPSNNDQFKYPKIPISDWGPKAEALIQMVNELMSDIS